jgi:hypothetical protein
MTIDTFTDNKFHVEKDALGSVQVLNDQLWGAQTQRSHVNFPIGVERYRWGRPVIRALGILKKCAALANQELGQLPHRKADLIVRSAQEVIDGKLDDQFPLVVFQTGSGTQTNVAACPNAAAMLFTSAKVAHLNALPQGLPERDERTLNMVAAMSSEHFGSCSNRGECEAVCPKGISLEFIAGLNHDLIRAAFRRRREPLRVTGAPQSPVQDGAS